MRVFTHVLCILLATSAFAGAEKARAQSDAVVGKETPPTSVRGRIDALRKSTKLPSGSVLGVEYMFERGEDIARGFPEASQAWTQRAERYLGEMEAGRDPYLAAHGQIVNRAYRSQISESTQGYAVYLPPEYDHSKSYPLIVVLHGGSSNGNLFLGVVLGNNMDWKSYQRYWWNQFEPRWKPDWIVVSPDGFGQVMWRWMGEQDVLDVIDDVQRHYNVDPDRVMLAGLSNGGVGAYAIGMRHAARFSAVQAMAGAPSWFQYTGGRPGIVSKSILQVSGIDLAANAANTDFRYYHGTTDTGPMKPRYVRELEERTGGEYITGKWYDAGHDILYRVLKHGRSFSDFDDARRSPNPEIVTNATADYRANTQHWLTVTRILNNANATSFNHWDTYPALARLIAKPLTAESAETGWKIQTKSTSNCYAFEVSLEPGVCPQTGSCIFEVDGQRFELDPIEEYGDKVGFYFELPSKPGHKVKWKLGFPRAGGLEKKPKLSGPISDAYFGRMVHVYGTAIEEDTDTLKKAAEKASRGWPLWPWNIEQRVIPDTKVTPLLAHTSTLVLYGNARSNRYLKTIHSKLPIQINDDGIRVGTKKLSGKTLGTRFIYPNPAAPNRYVIVQGGPQAQAAREGNNLPDFVPDYVVFESARLQSRPRLIFNNASAPLALGYFDHQWRFARPSGSRAHESAKAKEDATERTNEDDAKEHDMATPDPRSTQNLRAPTDRSGSQPADGTPWIESKLEPPEPPPPFIAPTRYLAPWSDQAGKAARQIARRYEGVDNYRTKARGGQWRMEPDKTWRIRKTSACHAELERLGIEYVPRPDHPTPVPAPVQLVAPVNGVWFRIIHDDRPLVISCELAARLPRLVKVLKAHGIEGVDVMSAYRTTPRASFHTAGLALDLSRFWDGKRWHSVAEDFESQPHHHTCSAPKPVSQSARKLLSLACAIDRLRIFATVLTPHYNLGHWDHFHLDMRPDDPRFFLR